MDDAERGRPDATTLTAFLILVTLAGGNAVAIRYSSCESCELDPFWAAAIRFLATTVIFAVIAIGRRLPFRRAAPCSPHSPTEHCSSGPGSA